VAVCRGQANQVSVIIFAFFKRGQRRTVDFYEGATQRLGGRTVVDAVKSGNGSLAAVPNEKEAPFDTSYAQIFVTGEALHAVTEQLEPQLTLDAVRPGDRSECDLALAAIA